MKKNLRIVSAAAAALLAVAPVAATAVSSAPVFAATTQTTNNGFSTGNSIQVNQNNEVSLGSLSYTGDTTNATLTKQLNSAVQKLMGTPEVSVSNVSYDKATKQVSFRVVAPRSWNDGNINLNNVQLSGAFWNQHLSESGDKVVAANNKSGDSEAKVLTFTATVVATPASTATPAAKPDTAKPEINAGSSSIFAADANTSVNISAVAKDGVIPSAINGNIVATIDGQSYTALLHGDTNTTVYEVVSKNGAQVMQPVSASNLKSDKLYYAHFNHVTMNLGNAHSGKSVSFTLPMGSSFAGNVAGAKYSNNYKSVDGTVVPRTITVTADANGVADLGTVVSRFYAYDAKNLQEVHFYAQKTGNVVTTGSLDLHAVNGKLSVQSVFAAMSHEYVASQLVKGTHSTNKIDTLLPQNDLRDQLKKQNIDVDANGYFTAPASFTLNMNAKSKINGATATLPVTINVDNAAQTPAANETTKNVTVMHIATIYDKTGKATNEPALRAYNSVSVVSEPVTINGAKFYKLAGKDQYVKVGNIDGTSRSLKKNSYVYKSNGKAYTKKSGKKTKKVLKRAGSSVTTYGKSFMIAGSQMYRIGHNQYIKKANF